MKSKRGKKHQCLDPGMNNEGKGGKGGGSGTARAVTIFIIWYYMVIFLYTKYGKYFNVE